MSSTKSFAPERFRRHAFVWLEPSDALFSIISEETAILRAWLEHRRPLIVRRPCLSADAAVVYLGLSLPPADGKRRLAFELPRALVREVADPPLWESCATAARDFIAPVQAAAEAGGAQLRIFGSHAWQHLTGLTYLTEQSDIDLLVYVETRPGWEAVRQRLERVALPPGIDLEIVLAGDASFSWRELVAGPGRILFKGNSTVWLGAREEISGLLRE